MNLFKKEIKVTKLSCLECNKPLEIDSNFETAFCSNCGAKYVVENIKHRSRKKSKYEITLDFIEKQQNILRKEKIERQRQKEEKEIESKENEKKKDIPWWGYVIIVGVLFAFITTFMILENKGII